MSSKLIYLHIGRGKTGTTAIQQFCTRNREALRLGGVYYIQAGDNGGHQAFAKSLLETLPDWMEADSKISTIQSEIRHELINSSGEIFLISSENFTLIEPQVIRSFFEEIFDQVRFKIIFFARSQDEVAESQYNQDVKWLGQTLMFKDYIDKWCDELHYDELLVTWEEIFAKENIIVRIYDGAKISVIPDFISCLPLRTGCFPNVSDGGILTNTGNIFNESIGFAVLETFRTLNTINLPRRRQIYRRIYEKLKGRDSPAIFFTSMKAREYRLRFQDSNRRFSARYLSTELDDLGGRRYSDPQRDAIVAARGVSLF